jgi:uncharacterized protein with HEPN domain
MIEQLIPHLQSWGHHALTLVLISVLVYFAYTFGRDFYTPGKKVSADLALALDKIREIKAKGDYTDLDGIRENAMVSATLKFCWDEFSDTLHGQKKADSQGVMQVNRYRATALANSFFTEQIVISTPLKAEFFKHLPGILTGIGIIGTFLGLILGLFTFDVSKDADQVRNSLRNLLTSVGNAFIVSLTAIGMAMWITWLEKRTINGLYTELDELCGLIDSLFEAGAGEEYLQRLVDASETSATQAMQMKESIVTDLKQVLTELTNQQIATMTATSQQLSQSIGDSITQGLVDPLTRISEAVQTVGNSQGEGVTKLLTDVMSRFVTEMDGMFGSQMRGMNDMLVQTASTIHDASQRFEQLANQIQQAGSGAADAMSKRVEEALLNMQNAQASSNEQMRMFVEQLKQNITQGQSESSELTKNLVKELSESTTALVRSLQDQTNSAQSAHDDRQKARDEQMNRLLEQLKENISNTQAESANATSQLLGKLGESTEKLVKQLEDQTEKARQEQVQRSAQQDASTTELLDNLKKHFQSAQSETASSTSALLSQLGEATQNLVKSLQEQGNQAQLDHTQRMADLVDKITTVLGQNHAQVSRLTEVVTESSNAMRDSISRLQTSTNTNIEKMGTGAEMLHGASVRLTENLSAVKASTEGLGANAKQLVDASSNLSNALSAMQHALGDQKSVRDAIGMMVADLKNTVENAKKDASLTTELVANLERASGQLQKAQTDAGKYLSGISEVLAKAHSEFATQLRATLTDNNKAYQAELAQATNYLKGAIQDLGDVLDSLPSSSK